VTIQFNRYVELVMYVGVLRYTIRNLHIEFDIELNRDSTPNIAKITIYNLSELTRSLWSQDHQALEFYAGYNPFDLPILPPLSVPLLFKGTTINVSHRKVKADWITEIIAGDGNKEFLESYFSKSYKKGTPITQLLTDLALAFKLPFTSDFVDPAAIMTRGESYSGKVKDILNQVADDFYLSWSFQNQVLEVVSFNQPPKKDLVATILSSDTGLLEQPILIERSDAAQPKKVDKTKVLNKPIRLGVQCKALLNGDLKPSRLFQVISPLPLSSLGIETLKRKGEIKLPTASTPYIADKVRHSGSNFGQTYETAIEGDVFAI